MYDEIIRLGNVYQLMMSRCFDENNASYHNYGARGIYVCQEWVDSRDKFVDWSLRNGSTLGLQLDRIDNDGPYAPWNCRYVTRLVNANNKRNSFTITAFNETKTAFDWSSDERCSVSPGVLKSRIARQWSPEAAITAEMGVSREKAAHNASQLTAWGETKGIREWLNDSRSKAMDHQMVWDRINNLGWSNEEALSKEPASNAGNYFEGKSVLEWSKDPRCSVGYGTLNRRLKAGWGVEDALTIKASHSGNNPELSPMYEGRKLRDIAKDSRLVVSRKTLEFRLRNGWEVEKAILTPAGKTQEGKKYEGRTVKEIMADPRTVVGESTLINRLKKGWSVEEASTKRSRAASKPAP